MDGTPHFGHTSRSWLFCLFGQAWNPIRDMQRHSIYIRWQPKAFRATFCRCFTAPSTRKIFLIHLNWKESIFCRHEKNSEDGCMCGKWMYLELTIKAFFRFAERNKKKFADVVIIETQSMSMIKVEFTISVKMSKKNLKRDDRILVDQYYKNEPKVFPKFEWEGNLRKDRRVNKGSQHKNWGLDRKWVRCKTWKSWKGLFKLVKIWSTCCSNIHATS